jgi:hypothetical protein
LLGTPPASRAITVGPFGAHGEGGSKNGQTFTIGTGGTVFEVDGFLEMSGADLNGPEFGVSAQLSRDPLPAGLGFSFTNLLSADQTSLTLSYTFTNTTSSTVFSNLYFFVLFDPEIDEQINTFFNEYATTNGAPGVHGYDPGEWQVDEPGYKNGNLVRDIFLGALNNSNAIPATAPNDVASSLGFPLGNLSPGMDATVLFQITENGNGLGSLSIVQHDSSPSSATQITSSGVMPVTGSQMNNPSRQLLVLEGKVVKDRSTNGPANPTGPGISGVTVLLMSNSIPVRTNSTDSGGNYQFSVPPGLHPGSYSVAAQAPNGLTFVPVGASQGAYFATSDPSTNTLPMTVPELNFDFRGAEAETFGNVSGLVKFGVQSWTLNRATGSLMGTLSITNPASSTASFGPPWQMGLVASTNYIYASPSGTLPDGTAYEGLGTVVVLGPGQSVVLTNAINIYSLYRTAPPNSQFEIWATQQ